MPPVAAAEYTVARTYIDWLIALPWSKQTEEVIDLVRTKDVLDADHSGLERLKDRILEYLAVRKLKPDVKGPILCFVGPPGVGKSTLTSAIALGMAEAGHQVGVIAVDPSSPFTGGAFMGDRIRMESLVGDKL